MILYRISLYLNAFFRPGMMDGTRRSTRIDARKRTDPPPSTILPTPQTPPPPPPPSEPAVPLATLCSRKYRVKLEEDPVKLAADEERVFYFFRII